jgi:hypothetical protein
MNPRLTPFFKELIEKRWSEFCAMEADADSHTSSQGVVFAIVRACADGKLPAIKESLNRIDGKLQEQIEVEYPKFFIQYPYAEVRETTVTLPGGKEVTTPEVNGTKTPPPEAPLVTGSLRDTLQRMSDAPKALVQAILDSAKDVDQRQAHSSDIDPVNDPLVKSVIVAGLLKMAHDGKLGAIFEVFDNIDGKLVDKIRILGEDVYLTSYDTIAPPNAKKNKDGVYQIEADNTTSKWALSLEKKGGNGKFQR